MSAPGRIGGEDGSPTWLVCHRERKCESIRVTAARCQIWHFPLNRSSASEKRHSQQIGAHQYVKQRNVDVEHQSRRNEDQ